MRSRPSFSIALLLLGALLATFAHGPAVPRPVFAAGPTCTVGASGANYTTIQAAIDDPTCVTISVANGTYTEHLTINRDVTIQGVSAVSTIIDGEQGGLVVDIPSMAADVTLARLTVQHGQVQSGLADGISNRGMLTLNDSAVVDNLRSSQSNAAGIYNTGTLSIANSRLANNGIMNSAGVLNMINSLVEQSGIYNYGGTATISGSTIRGNDGSGITNTSFYQSNDGISFTPMLGQLSMTNSTISGNRDCN
jgi:pectin methylesterase-like acyl-CoA thioesterase